MMYVYMYTLEILLKKNNILVKESAEESQREKNEWSIQRGGVTEAKVW